MEIRRRILPAFESCNVNPSSLSFSYGSETTISTVESGIVTGYDGIETTSGVNYYLLNVPSGSSPYGIRSAIINFKTTKTNTQIQISYKCNQAVTDAYLCIGRVDTEDINELPLYKYSGSGFATKTITVTTIGDHFIKIYYKWGANVVSGVTSYFTLLPYTINYGTNITPPSSQKVFVKSDNSWEIDPISVPSWVTLSALSGETGESEINVTLDANIGSGDRTATLNLICNNKSYYITIAQTHPDKSISLDHEYIHLIDKTSLGNISVFFNTIGNDSKPTVTLPSKPKIGQYSKSVSLNYGSISLSNISCNIDNELLCITKGSTGCPEDSSDKCPNNESQSDYSDISTGIVKTLQVEQEKTYCSCDCVGYCYLHSMVCECDTDACASNCPSEESCHCNARQTFICACDDKSPSCTCNNDTCPTDCSCQGVCACNCDINCACYNDKSCGCDDSDEYCTSHYACTSNCSCNGKCSINCTDTSCSTNCSSHTACSCDCNSDGCSCDCNVVGTCTCQDNYTCTCESKTTDCICQNVCDSNSGSDLCSAQCWGNTEKLPKYWYCQCNSKYARGTDNLIYCACNTYGHSQEYCDINYCYCDDDIYCTCDAATCSCYTQDICECDTKTYKCRLDCAANCSSKSSCTCDGQTSCNCNTQSGCSCNTKVACPSNCSCQGVCSCNWDEYCTCNGYCESNCDSYRYPYCSSYNKCSSNCPSNCTSNCDSKCSANCTCDVKDCSTNCNCNVQQCGCQSAESCSCNEYACADSVCSCNGYTQV